MYFTKWFGDLFSLGASNFGSKLILGLFWIFLAGFITKTQYGELGFLLGIVNVAAVISRIGLRPTVIVYESKNENVFPASFVLVLISSSLASVIVYTLIQNFVASLIVVGVSIFDIALAGLLANQKYRRHAFYVIIRSAITVILAIVLYQILGVNGILIGYFASTLLILKEISFLKNKRKIDFSVLRPKIKFIFINLGIQSSATFSIWGDKILIGSLFGFMFLGGYQLASQYLLLLTAVPLSIFQYLLPRESQGKKTKKIKILLLIFSGIASIISIIIIPWGVNNFLPHYSESIIPMQILSVGLIPYSIIAIQTSEFLGREKAGIVLWGGIIQVGTYFLAIVFLGQNFGMIGIAIGLLISLGLRVIYNSVTLLIYNSNK